MSTLMIMGIVFAVLALLSFFAMAWNLVTGMSDPGISSFKRHVIGMIVMIITALVSAVCFIMAGYNAATPFLQKFLQM